MKQTADFQIVCLCAAWCRVCDEYAPVLDRITAEVAIDTPALSKHWIDIEDEAELVGDFDVETLPTLLVIGPDGVRFAGPLLPHAQALRLLLRVTLVDADAGKQWPAVEPEVEAFAQRLRARKPRN